MQIMASSAGQVTVGDVFSSLWRGFKALPVAVYHLAVNHDRASVLEICYVAGVILFCVVISAVAARFRRR